MTTKQGFILPMVLIFMQIFSLLSVYGMENSLTTMQLIQLSMTSESDSHLAAQILKQLSQLDSGTSCLVQANLNLHHQTLAWWQGNACKASMDERNYYYVLQHLGIDACAKIQDANADYYRLTVYLMTTSRLTSRLLVQNTYIKPVHTIDICTGDSHPVLAGQQMWVEFR